MAGAAATRTTLRRSSNRPYAALLARGVVFRAALGNHDMKTRDGQDEVEAYERFRIERPEGY